MVQKPSLPKGTRDFSPEEVSKRQYIFDVIKDNFQRFGYSPIETPSFENSETLLGKYGEEGDRLIFKILNSGDFLAKADEKHLQDRDSLKISNSISEKALRYDLTVPFARYVVQHQNEISFPFKRYQIQPVWRADRPQKGRFREFFQCDADVVGSKSLWQEVELIQLYDSVFKKLKLEGVVIKINNRKILAGIAEIIGAADKLIDFTVALDKLDKIGADGVTKEMLEKGISAEAISKIEPLLDFKGSNDEKISKLSALLSSSEIGMKGIEEVAFVTKMVSVAVLDSSAVDIDVTLARGLNYYTGCILEVAAPPSVSLGSIGGGGRYDDLTGIFGLKDVSGVGVSFGLDRLYLVLEELNLFPEEVSQSVDAIFLNYGKSEVESILPAIKILRESGLKIDLYPDAAKMGKQMQYVDKRKIRFAILVGEDEMVDNVFTIKDLREGTQATVDFQGLKKILQNV